MRIDIFKPVATLRPFVHKIILRKYTSFWTDPTYVLVLTVCLGMSLIITDFPTGSKVDKCHTVIVYFLLGNL